MNPQERSTYPAPVTGLILTGGKNTRMGGQVKFFLRCGEEYFGDRILRALSALEETCLSVDRADAYRHLPYPVIPDEFPGQGPMAGILSGMHARPGRALFVVPSDCPCLTQEMVVQICSSYQKKGILTLACINGRTQPLLGIYPPALRMLLEDSLAAGDRKMMHVLEKTAYQMVCFSMPEEVVNVNSVEEYRRFLGIDRK